MGLNIDMRSETAKELQSSIQHGLAQRDYSTPDDPVMAEYITVMLANNKTEEQITVELADLIGPEYDATFTRWLFEEAGRIVSGAHRAPPTVKLEPEPEPVPRPRSLPRGEPSRRTSSASQRENGYDRPPHEQRRPREDLRTSNERDWDGGRQRERAIRGRVIDHWEPGMSMDTSNNEESRSTRNGPTRELFSAAMAQATRTVSGSKRRASMRSPSLVEGSTQSDSKMRMDDSEMGSDIPTGPRKRLAMDDPSFAESRNVLDVPSRPRAMRIRGAARNAGVSPRTDGQAADNKANGLSIFGRAGVPDPHAPAFVPGARGAPNSVSDVDVNAGVGGFGQSAVASPSFGSPSSNGMLSLAARIDPMVPSNNTLSPPPAPIPSHSSSQVFPSTPTQTALCRYGLRCTNPACEYSHPTPAAARRGISGSNGNEAAVDEPLVLSESACRFGSRCTNKECTYSHPSPAISFLASKARGGTSNAGLPSLQSSAGEIPCRFQAACTNAGCPYAHFDENGNVGPSPALSGLARAVPISAASLATGTERGMDVDEDVDFDLTGTPPTEGASTTSGSSAAKAGGEWTNTSTGPGKLAALDLALGSSMGKGIGGGDMSGKRCRFGAACTRADCVFGHPPNRRVPPGSGYGSGSGAGAGGNSSGQAPCRFGAGCTRADCYFSHPPNRILPISSGSGSGGKAPHISERLKRFAGDGSADNGDGGEGEVERIIPGQAVETST